MFSLSDRNPVKTIVLALALSMPCGSQMAVAQESDSVQQQELQNLARQFMRRVGGKLDDPEQVRRILNIENEQAEETKSSAKTPDEAQQLTFIPDGEGLLFRPVVERYQFDSDIYSIKRSSFIYISMLDFIETLRLAIEISENGASGWFLREDWEFELDTENMTLSSRGVQYDVDPEDFFFEDRDIFIKSGALEEWMGFEIDFDFSLQYVNLVPPYPLPELARNKRQDRRGINTGVNQAVLPRLEQEADWLDINTADITLRGTYQRSGTNEGDTRGVANFASGGQLLKHQAYTLLNFDDDKGLNSASMRLFKQSEDPELLGPLKARSYEIGDVQTTRLPLTGSAARELGMYVTNDTLSNSDFETTVIRGDAIPGWDVELYRNNALIGLQTIGEEGIYEFDDVTLFLGDNDFELLFYGVQGEVRSEAFNIPVNRELLDSQDGIYEASVTFAETQTYRADQPEDDDRGQPHVAGSYSFSLGDAIATVGGRYRSINGDTKAIVSGGLSGIQDNYLYNWNVAADNDLGLRTDVNLRRNFENDKRLSLNAGAGTDTFSPNNTDNPSILNAGASYDMRYDPFIGGNGRLNLDYDINMQADKSVRHNATAIASQRIADLNVTNSLNYVGRDSEDPTRQRTFDQTLGIRGVKGRFLWRTAFNYDYLPEAGLDLIDATLTYTPSNTFTLDTDVTHDPDQDFSTVEFRANYIQPQYRLSPFLRIDSESDLFAGVSLNTGIIDDPGTEWPILTGRNATGVGFVSAFVFLDKDGDWQYDPDVDDTIENVIVESVNIRRRIPTNARGFSLLPNLSTVQATDVRIDQESFPDPFMIAAYPGKSIFPQEGEISDIIFPVFNSGEIDGTVRIKTAGDRFKTVRQATVRLVPFDPKIETMTSTAIQDGFFIFSRIRPGRYFMFVDHEDADFNLSAAPPPKIIDIGYGGDTLFGRNINMREGLLSIPFKVTYREDIPALPGDMLKDVYEDDSKPRPQYFLRLDRKGSNPLLRMLESIEIKRIEANYLKGLKRFETYDEQKQERVFRYRPKINSYAEAAYLCETLVAEDIACTVEAIPPEPLPNPKPGIVPQYVAEFLNYRSLFDLDKLEQKEDFLSSDEEEQINVISPARESNERISPDDNYDVYEDDDEEGRFQPI